MINKLISTGSIIISILLGFLMAGNGLAHAQSSDFTLYPTYQHGNDKHWIIQTTEAGSSLHESVTLENFSDQPQTFSTLIQEAENDHEDFHPTEKNLYENQGLLLKTATTKYQVAPHGKIKIPLEIVIGKNLPVGEYPAVIYAEKEQPNNQNIKVVTRIGVRIYLKVITPNMLSTNIFTTPEFQKNFFFLLSFIGIFASIFYNLIHILEHKTHAKQYHE